MDDVGEWRAGMLDLPDETLLHLLGFLVQQARAVGRIALTCRRLYCVASDRRLWAECFWHDFFYQYAQGVPAIGWTDGAHPDDPWPAEARTFWTQNQSKSDAASGRGGKARADAAPPLLWPECPYDREAPTPFAHFETAGKTWQWLYRAHALFLKCGRTGPCTRLLGNPRVVPRKKSVCCLSTAGTRWVSAERDLPTLSNLTHTVLYVGDLNRRGQPHGYGVQIHFTMTRQVCKWIETEWHKGAPVGWRTVVSRKKAVCSLADVHRSDARLVHIVRRNTRVRAWGLARCNTLDGACLWAHACGSIETGIAAKGLPRKTTAVHRCGRACTYAFDDRGRRHGWGTCRYHNGDMLIATYDHGDWRGVVAFQVSPHCDDLELAGRLFRPALPWRSVDVETDNGTVDHAYWPDARDDSDEARLFWRHASSGAIGWHPSVARAALAHLPPTLAHLLAPAAGQARDP